jgi:3-oxoadipate enol-lactonase
MVRRMLVQIEDAQARGYVRDELVGHDPVALVQAVRALTRFSSRAWIERVDVPAAVVVTTRDAYVPELRQRALAASIAGAETFDVDGDHDACVRSSEFATTLVRACRSVAARGQRGPAPRAVAGSVP